MPTVAVWVLGTAIKHPVPDLVMLSFVIFLTSGHSDAQLEHQSAASECPDVKNYKCQLNPVWHRIAVPIYDNNGRQMVNWPTLFGPGSIGRPVYKP